jgi:hypothetical protein
VLAAFAESGYTKQGDRLVGPDGEQLRITILTANGYTDWLRAVQEVRGQLGAIGIDVQIQAPQPAGYQSAIANGEFDMAMGGMGNGNVYQAFNNLLNSEFATPVGETTAANFERFSDPAVDALLDEWKASTDPADQQRLSYRLQNVVYDQLPVIGLYYGGLWGLFNDAKFTGWPTAEDPYMAPQNYDQAPLLIFTKLKRVQNDGETSEVRRSETRSLRAHPVGRGHPELHPAEAHARQPHRRRDREALAERPGLRGDPGRHRGPARRALRQPPAAVRELPRPGRATRLRHELHVLPRDRRPPRRPGPAVHAHPRRRLHDHRVRAGHAHRGRRRLEARHVARLAAHALRQLHEHVPVLLDGPAAAVLPRLRAALVPDHRRTAPRRRLGSRPHSSATPCCTRCCRP